MEVRGEFLNQEMLNSQHQHNNAGDLDRLGERLGQHILQV